MEHKTLAELKRAADTAPIPVTRTERLQRWAAALAKLGASRLSSLLRTEYVAPEALGQVRADNSPLSVAAEDPVLRVAGLKNDTFGEAMRFFDLSEHELHRIVCYCHWERIDGPGAAGTFSVRPHPATRLLEQNVRNAATDNGAQPSKALTFIRVETSAQSAP